MTAPVPSAESVIRHRVFAHCSECGRDVARWEDREDWWHLDGNLAHDHRAHVAAETCRDDALRRQAVLEATRKWQMGGWTVLTEALKTEGIPALACGQAATDWFRAYAAETYPKEADR